MSDALQHKQRSGYHTLVASYETGTHSQASTCSDSASICHTCGGTRYAPISCHTDNYGQSMPIIWPALPLPSNIYSDISMQMRM